MYILRRACDNIGGHLALRVSDEPAASVGRLLIYLLTYILTFDVEDGGSTFLRHVDKPLKDYTASHPIIPHSLPSGSVNQHGISLR
jgi:hypothetical protein